MNELTKQEREHLETILKALVDRWRILDEQRAKFGELDFPTHKKMELKEVEAEIEEICTKLGILPPFILGRKPELVREEVPEIQSPISMLVVISAPATDKTGQNPPSIRLDVWREWQNICEAVRINEHQYHPVRITRLFPPTREMLEKTLMNHPYDIFHFIGHGTRAGLVFEDEYGTEEIVKINELVSLFSQGKIRKLAVFNACHSSNLGNSLSAHIPSIISTTQTIYDEAAKIFTRTFYPSLFAGQPIAQALERANEEIGRQFPSQSKILNLIGKKDTSIHLPIVSEEPKPSFGEPRTHLLPYPLEFIGQGERLVKLASELRSAENRAIILSGIGGIGKTYLAQMAAHRNAWRFPAGILYFKIETQTEVEHIVEAIGSFFDIKPAQVAERLSWKSCLLILDNVEVMIGEEQKRLKEFLESFDPRQGTKVLLTSRAHLSVFERMDATLPYSVKDFTEAEALLSYEAERLGIWGKIKSEKDNFIEYTRHHPLFITMSVSMAKRDGVEPTLNNLRSLAGKEVTEAVNDFFGKMIESLDERAGGLLKRLVIFAGGFDYPAIKSICGATGFDQLTTMSIIDHDITLGRYSLHQLVLDYIKKYLPLLPQEEEEVNLKAAQYYCQVAKNSKDP